MSKFVIERVSPSWVYFRDVFLSRHMNVYNAAIPVIQRAHLIIWIAQGRPEDSIPSGIKHQIIKRCAKNHSINALIETGTFYGDMLWACKDEFDVLYSIELSENFYNLARKRFRDYINVHLLCGDSAHILPELLKEINRRCIFWLDAHYFLSNTAIGERVTPIEQEMNCILSHGTENVILIDDANLFTGEFGYPKLGEFITSLNDRGFTGVVERNIIVCEPK